MKNIFIIRKLIFISIASFCTFINAQEDTSVALNIPTEQTLSFGNPIEVGLDSTYIHTKVDSIITLAIKNEAFPGAQILVAKQGKIIFHKAYGYHTYDSIQPVGLNDMYDLASVTKIMGPLPAIMKLVDEGKLKLDAPFSTYWKPWQKVANKKDLTLREILAHQAGLTPYIVFLNEVIKKNGKLKRKYIRKKRSKKFALEAYEGLFVRNTFNKVMYDKIEASAVGDKKYKYSGLTFLIFPKLIEQLTGQLYEDYVTTNFYQPLGAYKMGFRPKTKHFTNAIVPTEVDTIFRHTLTKGWVHDENAALLGGISGNAGLFATAEDLARLMQMYMNYGVYNGKRYISEATLKEFTKVQYPENDNRRGLGFDKPSLNNSELTLAKAYPAPEVSPNSFGHSGFTGTFVWADPDAELVYIFLSNRVNPSRTHSAIYKLNVRPAVQEVFYKAAISKNQIQTSSSNLKTN